MLWKDRLRHHSGTILLLGIWLTIWSVPELRLLCRMQVRGSEYASTSAFTPFVWKPPVAPTVGELTRLYPHSIEARAKAPAQRGDGELAIAIARQRYDALLHDQPDNLWLLATRLRMAVQELQDGRRTDDAEQNLRNASPLSDWPTVGLVRASLDDASDYGVTTVSVLAPFRPTPRRPLPIDAHIYQYIALSERGRKLEPNNCFYDWALAYFLFALRRDGEALAALHAGGHKPYYDSHLRDEMRAALMVGELGHPLSFEERQAIAAAQYEARNDRIAHLTWLVRWAGYKAERQDNYARALSIYSDLATMGARMQTAQPARWAAIEGLRVQLAAWSRWTQQTAGTAGFNGWEEGMSDATINKMARNFMAYATSHGRLDLAAQTAQQVQTALQLNDLYNDPTNQYNLDRWGAFGVPTKTAATLETFDWATGLTLLQLQLAFVSWLTATLLLWKRMNWFWRLLGWVWRSISRLWDTPQATPRPTTLSEVPTYSCPDLWRSLIFSGSLVALAGCIMFRFDILKPQWEHVYPNSYEIPFWVASGFYIVGPLCCGLLWIGGAILWRYRPPRLTYSLWRQALPGVAFSESQHTLRLPSICYLIAACWVWTWTIYAAIAWLLLGFTQYVLSPASPTPLFWGITTRDITISDCGLPWALTVPAILSWLIKWWWQIAPEQKFRAFHTGLWWYRDLLRQWLLIGSAVYLLWLLASLPTRHRADAQLSAFLNQTPHKLATEIHSSAQKVENGIPATKYN